MSRTPQRIPCGLLQILHRPFVVLPFLKVHCQFRGDLTRSATVGLFEPLSDLHMKLLPLTYRDALVPEVLIQCMAKAIASCLYTIGPLAVSRWSQKLLPTYQDLATRLYVCGVDPDGSSYGCAGELLSSDARCPHNLLFFFIEPINLPSKKLPNTDRNFCDESVHRSL